MRRDWEEGGKKERGTGELEPFDIWAISRSVEKKERGRRAPPALAAAKKKK